MGFILLLLGRYHKQNSERGGGKSASSSIAFVSTRRREWENKKDLVHGGENQPYGGHDHAQMQVIFLHVDYEERKKREDLA